MRTDGPSDTGRAQVDALLERIAQLETALESRVVIEQAKGVLAERHGISTQQAFELLRRTARNTRRGIHELAAAIVASAERSSDG